MKTSTPPENSRDAPVMVRRADASLKGAIALAVPDSGVDVEAVERALIEFALERTRGNRTHAARFLGLSRSALIYRMHKHGLVQCTAETESADSEDGGHR
jgi:two-component system NtrC family response regulator